MSDPTTTAPSEEQTSTPATAEGATSAATTRGTADGAAGDTSGRNTVGTATPSPAARPKSRAGSVAGAVARVGSPGAQSPSPVAQGIAVFLLCMALFLGIWQAAISVGAITGLAPGPVDVFRRGAEILADPFYRDGPSSVGIFWHLLASLQRVLIGFLIAAAIAIPVGFLLGMIAPLRWGLEPLVQILRPVSPLAWLPIGLALLRDSENTALFVIIMSALWPMLLQTTAGVMGINPLYRDLARTLGTNRRDTFRHILLPATLPSIVTGMRLSLSTAWLVIIAAEMLVGGRGMGYFVWNMWNRLDIAAIVVAIVIIGLIGFALDQIVSNIQKVIPSA